MSRFLVYILFIHTYRSFKDKTKIMDDDKPPKDEYKYKIEKTPLIILSDPLRKMNR